jgi:CRP-like cAMP-binding protein
MCCAQRTARSADVTALDYCKFLTLSQRAFREIMRRHPDIRARIATLAKERGEMNRQWLDAKAPEDVPQPA